MSLITVGQRVRGAGTRTLLLLLGASAAIIVGLLAMHALSASSPGAGHGDMVSMADVAFSDTQDFHEAAPAAAPAESLCADCGDDHGMASMSCILALLVGVILFALFRAGRLASRRDAGVRGIPNPWLPSARDAPPPSLVVLCISRT
ncbi:DUF6153 family protein [Microbacterium sp. SLBN-111]|uniref:DUF6153 family protein n=1 Tax=Microbacterium sp. SLBN-111 TaxID=3377733 RepID=UPI003C797150